MTGFEPVTSSLPRKCSTTELHWQNLKDLRAEDEAQTRDPQLGRLMLYQLSYFRDSGLSCGRGWIRTTEVERQQIYSLPHLATLEHAQISFSLCFFSLGEGRASCRIRTNDPEITNHVLWPTELKRQLSKNSCESGFRRWASVSFAVAKLSNIFEPRKYFNKIFRDFRRRFKAGGTAAAPHSTESTFSRIQPLCHPLINFSPRGFGSAAATGYRRPQ